MRSLAIDLGSRRVGVALSDESGRFAFPLEVVLVHSDAEAARLVAAIAVKQSAEQLVVGLPLNMDDSFGPAARAAVKWGQDLSGICNLPVIFIDERLSSFAAEQSLIDEKRQGRKITRKQKKQRQDAIAAADFLQAFLDGKLSPVDVTQ